ncbi:MAG TPA: FecR domain-containing protein, partial [Caulifigura sp.]|nr:FecR domain-containing protein [Caulifigura sp.]
MSDLQKSVDQWLDGELTDEAHAALNDRLKVSRQDALEFAKQVTLHSLLRELHRRDASVASALPETSPPARPRFAVPQRPPRRSHALAWAGVCLGVVAFLSVGLLTWRGRQPGILMPAGVAALIDRESTAVEAAGFADGRLYPGARLRFNRGHILLRFGDEATVTLTGDADLEVQSTRRAILHRGQVTATVAEAGRGFTIGTPRGDVVDLGTRFGVNVRA